MFQFVAFSFGIIPVIMYALTAYSFNLRRLFGWFILERSVYLHVRSNEFRMPQYYNDPTGVLLIKRIASNVRGPAHYHIPADGMAWHGTIATQRVRSTLYLVVANSRSMEIERTW